MNRRMTALLAALSIGFAGVAFAVYTGPFGGGAASTTVYGCFNSGGHLEASTVGLTPQTCAHASDAIQSWTVAQYVPPGTTTTTTTTTTSAATTTTVGSTTSTTVAATSTTVGATTTTGAPAGGFLTSAHSLKWYWQLSSVPAAKAGFDVVDFDCFDATAADVAAWHATGAKVIGYFSAGTAENFRPDYASFPSSVLGATNGWPGERWLDIRQTAILEPIMAARAQMCQAKGVDALEWDNEDGAFNSTSFSISSAQQQTYDAWLAGEAHAVGLKVALKNTIELIPTMEPLSDFAINEEAFRYGETSGYSAFTSHGKAVLNAEYSASAMDCPLAASEHIDSALFDLNLTGSVFKPCGAW